MSAGGKDGVDNDYTGYRRHVQLEDEELARLEAAILARPLVFEVWSLHNHARPAGEAANRVSEI